uniref:FIIND domain-containing protein n=1 Tax=Cyprinus carpio TaxID=7962 RepID=A0A8C2JFX9_CYPCA
MRWNEHCDLLLYMRSKAPLILHVYLFPFEARAKAEVEKIEKSSYLISHPRPDRPFRMKTPNFLEVPGASVHPKEGITLRREMDPNFFKIKASLENDLQMTLIREEDKKIVWTATIKKEELVQIHPQRDESRLKNEAEKARYFDDHWPDLIQRVTDVQIIADKLLQQKIINEELYSEITERAGSVEVIRMHHSPVSSPTEELRKDKRRSINSVGLETGEWCILINSTGLAPFPGLSAPPLLSHSHVVS